MNAPTPFAPQHNFDVGNLYTGMFLKADDLAGNTYSAAIAAVERVEVPETDGSIRAKAALTLPGWPAKLLLNKTNYETIAAAYGRQSAGWIGKPIEVYPDTVFFAGRSVPCVRVRVPRPAAPPAAFPGAALTAAAPAAPLTPAAPLAPAAPPLASAVPDAPGTAHAALTPPVVTGDPGDDIPY